MMNRNIKILILLFLKYALLTFISAKPNSKTANKNVKALEDNKNGKIHSQTKKYSNSINSLSLDEKIEKKYFAKKSDTTKKCNHVILKKCKNCRLESLSRIENEKMIFKDFLNVKKDIDIQKNSHNFVPTKDDLEKANEIESLNTQNLQKQGDINPNYTQNMELIENQKNISDYKPSEIKQKNQVSLIKEDANISKHKCIYTQTKTTLTQPSSGYFSSIYNPPIVYDSQPNKAIHDHGQNLVFVEKHELPTLIGSTNLESEKIQIENPNPSQIEYLENPQHFSKNQSNVYCFNSNISSNYTTTMPSYYVIQGQLYMATQEQLIYNNYFYPIQ